MFVRSTFFSLGKKCNVLATPIKHMVLEPSVRAANRHEIIRMLTNETNVLSIVLNKFNAFVFFVIFRFFSVCLLRKRSFISLG